MDLFELEKEKKIKILKRKTINNKIKLLRDQLGLKATDYSAVKIKSTPKRNKELIVLGKIEEMEKDLEYIEQELNIIDESLNSLYKIFNEYKDRDKQIYIEKKLYKFFHNIILLNFKINIYEIFYNKLNCQSSVWRIYNY